VILGAGPAGSSAAIAARREGRAVCLIEKSKLPRHKVCGEFFSPEIAPELERLGVWDAFQAAGPARVRRMTLHLGRREKSSLLPEPAWGLSRFAFDHLLLRGTGLQPVSPGQPTIIASGRSNTAGSRGSRLFGFKAHFEGPVDDAVELFFFNRCYVGINSVERGITNVCGLGPEDLLRRFDFDYDRLVAESPALRARLAPLTRSMKWLSTGPLRYGQSFDPTATQYLAGDALSFVDPFTGSGLVAAVKTGALAGAAAAQGEPVAHYLQRCRTSLKKPFEIAGIFRKAVEDGWAEWVAPLVPGRILFALTRPQK
jgi:menaquinone-9 beta-reductase